MPVQLPWLLRPHRGHILDLLGQHVGGLDDDGGHHLLRQYQGERPGGLQYNRSEGGQGLIRPFMTALGRLPSLLTFPPSLLLTFFTMYS